MCVRAGHSFNKINFVSVFFSSIFPSAAIFSPSSVPQKGGLLPVPGLPVTESGNGERDGCVQQGVRLYYCLNEWTRKKTQSLQASRCWPLPSSFEAMGKLVLKM